MTDRPNAGPSGARSLSPADWARVESMIDALLDTPPERRAAVLAEMSGGDPARRAELERLVAECERPHPLLDQPATERFSALVDEQAVTVSAALADRYSITRELGRGGMATVYLARDIRHSRDVAVKVMRSDLAATLGDGRFLREVEIAAGLRHPNIVPVYDSGEGGGLLYYVMPYEAGHSLRERLAQDGPFSIDEAVLILRDVCDALAHAHRHGIVHRDVKPDNVLLSGRHAMVTDFGVAKALTSAVAAGRSGTDPVTAGVSLGTPAYMAPEQVAADPRIDHRADIYAVGVLAYELLSGHPPFQGDEPQSVLAAQLTQLPEPLTTHRLDVPPALAELVMKCLEKRPADRWQSADILLAQLENLVVPSGGFAVPAPVGARVVAETPPASQTPTSTGKRWLAAVVATTVVAAGALLAVLWMRGSADPAPTLDRANIVVVPFRVTGADSSLRYLSDGVVDLLAARLAGEGGPLAVDSRTAISAWNQVRERSDDSTDPARRVARAVGAGEALFGSIIGLPGNRLTITASLISASGGAARPAAAVTGPIDSLPYLLDAIVTRLVARQAGVTEQTLGALTSESVPALRAYLWGRAEYRRGHESEAVQHFAHALEIDSGFALAALDLVVATGQVIGTQALCPSPACLTSYFTVGYRNTWPESDQLRLTRAVQLAWTFRDKLSPRDRPLLAALRGEHYPAPSTARELLAALQRAAVAAPDRVETQYLLGTLLLYQGPAMGIGDSRARAGAAFRRALELDPAYAAPIAGLVEVAAFDGDATELRRAGALYLAHDSTGATAAYIRWRVAAGLNDEVALSLIRARFDSLATSTLQRIAHASQMTGVALADADRAMALIVERAADPLERRIALGSAYMLAMNRGRPREAAALMTRRSELGPPDKVNLWTWTTMAALYWGGDTAVGQASARARAGLIARDTTNPPDNAKESLELSRHMTQQALWDVAHGDTARAVAAIAWLRVNANPVGADFVDVLLATATRRSDADTLRARLDSMALEGCCSTDVVHWMNFVDALAHEKAGSDADALRAVRRGIWRYPPQLLSTFLREEGRLAAGLGDAPGAIRAYRHYLALRSDPEPELKPEADSVRAELARLERRR